MASPITRAPPVELAYGEEARASADAPQSRSDKLSEGDLEEDSKPRHECGVFGVYSTSLRNASRVTFFALYALNHRGQVRHRSKNLAPHCFIRNPFRRRRARV